MPKHSGVGGGGGCLDGLVFAFNAYSAFKNTNIKDLILCAGGEISTNVTKKVHFLLCTSPLRDSSKVKLASRYGICLIKEEYALDCITSNRRLDPVQYTLQPTLSDGNDDGDGERGEGEGEGGNSHSESEEVRKKGGDDDEDIDEDEEDDDDDEDDDGESSDEDVHWCYEDDSGKWIEFDPSSSNAIEENVNNLKGRPAEVKIDASRYVDLKCMLLRHYNLPKKSNRLKRTCFGARVVPPSSSTSASSTSSNPPSSSSLKHSPPALTPTNSMPTLTPYLPSSYSLSQSTSSLSSPPQAMGYDFKQQKRLFVPPPTSSELSQFSKKQRISDSDSMRGKWYWQEQLSAYGRMDRWIEYEANVSSLLEEAFRRNQECIKLDSRTYVDFKHMEQGLIDNPLQRCPIRREVVVASMHPYSYLPLAHNVGGNAGSIMAGYPANSSAATQAPQVPLAFYQQSVAYFQQNMSKSLKEDSFVPGAHDKPSPMRMNTFRNFGVSSYELLKDRIFTEYVVLIGNFIGYSFFTKHAEEVLSQRGFNTITVTDEAEFISNLPKCNVAWILSGNPRNSVKENHRVPWLNTSKQKFADACLDFHKCGGGLFVWADNEPLYEQANTILPYIMKIELIGESPANQKLILGNSAMRGQFGRHMITSGISLDLYEGHSVCFPKDGDCGLMKVLATSTDDHPCILYSDVQRDSLVGRVVVDCGWTKLAVGWENAGNARYVFNATVWLLALDVEPLSHHNRQRALMM